MSYPVIPQRGPPYLHPDSPPLLWLPHSSLLALPQPWPCFPPAVRVILHNTNLRLSPAHNLSRAPHALQAKSKGLVLAHQLSLSFLPAFPGLPLSHLPSTRTHQVHPLPKNIKLLAVPEHVTFQSCSVCLKRAPTQSHSPHLVFRHSFLSVQLLLFSSFFTTQAALHCGSLLPSPPSSEACWPRPSLYECRSYCVCSPMGAPTPAR